MQIAVYFIPAPETGRLYPLNCKRRLDGSAVLPVDISFAPSLYAHHFASFPPTSPVR